MRHLTTLQKICSALFLSPEFENYEEKFVIYIRNRVNYIKDYEKNNNTL